LLKAYPKIAESGRNMQEFYHTLFIIVPNYSAVVGMHVSASISYPQGELNEEGKEYAS